MTKEDAITFARIGGKAKLSKYGRIVLVEMGRKGGKSTFARHGRDHFRRISKMGVDARRRKKQNA